MSELFYLTSRHGDCGNNVMFHNKNGAGYGTNLNNLQLFTLEEAQRELRHDIKSLPLLKSEVDKLAVDHVDMQLLMDCGRPENMNDKCVVQINGRYDGNDITFATFAGETYDFKEAEVVSYQYALGVASGGNAIWLHSYIQTLARPTFQRENINTRKMITGAGIVYKKPRK